MNIIINNKDELIMSLVHYFVTEENYTPINVQGAKNEIWLENLDNPYRIVRINFKYIHNMEQYNTDLFKMHFVMKQIKKKTLSLKMNALNICLDVNDNVKLDTEDKTIDSISVSDLNDLKKNKLLGKYYPKITTSKLKNTKNLDEIINATEDINKKTARENNQYEDIFKPKKIVMTKVIIAICVIMYFISLFITNDFTTSLVLLGANNKFLVMHGEVYRLITSAFLHGNLFHLLINMYSLWIIGSQMETFVGKTKFTIIYLLSALMGGLFSVIFLKNGISIGASGAIFGLLGAFLYFGYHYRLYLSNALTTQIIPIVILNLILGFTITGIDNASHIGGLIGGYLATMIVGLKYKSSRSENINGLIVYTLLVVFLIYVLFNLA